MNRNEIELIYKEVCANGNALCGIDGCSIALTHTTKKKNISFSGVVYKGEGFIPEKIREIARKPYFSEDEMKTQLFIEEECFSIYLCYVSSSRKESFVSDCMRFCEKMLFWQELFSEKDEEERLPVLRKKSKVVR